MEIKERFEKTAVLISKLDEHKKTGTIRFSDMDEKLTLKAVYQSLYGNIQVDLSCSTCVFHYLNMLQAWYQRERPKHLATIVSEVPVDVEEIPVESKIEDAVIEKIPTVKPMRKIQQKKIK